MIFIIYYFLLQHYLLLCVVVVVVVCAFDDVMMQKTLAATGNCQHVPDSLTSVAEKEVSKTRRRRLLERIVLAQTKPRTKGD